MLQLLHRFPDRFVMLRYEDMSGLLAPEISKALLNFAQLPNITDLSSISSLNKVFDNYWQENITIEMFTSINNVCREIIQTLGYSLF